MRNLPRRRLLQKIFCMTYPIPYRCIFHFYSDVFSSFPTIKGPEVSTSQPCILSPTPSKRIYRSLLPYTTTYTRVPLQQCEDPDMDMKRTSPPSRQHQALVNHATRQVEYRPAHPLAHTPVALSPFHKGTALLGV